MIPKKILNITKNVLAFDEEMLQIANVNAVANIIDELVHEATFGEDENKLASRWIIWELAQTMEIYPSSIHDFYIAKGTEKLPLNFTVPAMNLRGMAYDSAIAVFNVAKKLNMGAFIFELARSEMGYTGQSPSEYTTVILGAAIKTGWKGPVFMQGDHFQTKNDGPGKPKTGEVNIIKDLIEESINYGFFNIDIDTSTLVDLDQPNEDAQQAPNIQYSLEFAKHVRNLEPKGITVSLGGEIGHIGGKNSTVEEYNAYIKGFNSGISDNEIGMSKISIQTGTSHGGVVLPDGSLADINVDFQVLLDVSRECRKVGMGGAVQHGASTLPDEYFSEFAKAEAVEVHLATGFQNIIMDHDSFPKDLLDSMYEWLDKNKSDEKKADQTVEQFHYKLRKKAWGKFKKETWEIDNKLKKDIMDDLENRFEFLFTELNVEDTNELVKQHTNIVEIRKSINDFSLDTVTKKQVKGLAD